MFHVFHYISCFAEIWITFRTMYSVQYRLPDGFINIVVDDGQVEEVSVCLSQAVALLSQTLQGPVIVLQQGIKRYKSASYRIKDISEHHIG